MNGKKNECLESESKKETILDFHLVVVRDMYLGEKRNHAKKPEASKRSADSTEDDTEAERPVDEVWSKSENYGMTWCTCPKEHGIRSGED